MRAKLVFEGSVHVLGLAASTFAVPDLQPKCPASVQKAEMLLAEAACLSISLLARSSFAF